MRRPNALALAALVCACSSHPPEGTIIDPGPGVESIPGGKYGVAASRAVPVSGGTLLVAQDGHTAVAADPDRDRVWLVDLASQAVTEVVLQQGDEPGRLVEDAARRVHVALRQAGDLVTIDLASGSVAARRHVCPSPRGVAYDAVSDQIHVACRTGELVSLPASGGEAVRVLRPADDLRDVMVDGDHLLVTRFRSAELMVLDSTGSVVSTQVPPTTDDGFSPAVAWRSLRLPSGQVAMVHQRGSSRGVTVQPGGYGSSSSPQSCTPGIVHGTISLLPPTGADTSPDNPAVPPVISPPYASLVGPSDVAVSRDGSRLAAVSIGNSWGVVQPFDQGTIERNKLVVVGPEAVEHANDCATPGPEPVEGEPIAVAFDGSDRVVVQSREPAQLQIMGGPTIRLGSDSRADTGLALFHMSSSSGVACASCHPEGTDDGRVWSFDELGPRRTQNIAGGVMGTAPFHWAGDMRDFDALIVEVLVSRMGAPRPNQPQGEHFARFIDNIPEPGRPVVDPSAAERGRLVFEQAKCGNCHSGSRFTNNASYDVGTGGTFQVPSLLGVGLRAPYLHDGCARTLADRFDPHCGGDRHGDTAGLGTAEVADLVTYLESL